MGRGNTLPNIPRDANGEFVLKYEMFYVNPSYNEEGEITDDDDEQFHSDLDSILPKSFDKPSTRLYNPGGYGQDELIYAYNTMVQVCFKDNERSLAVIIREIQDNDRPERNFAPKYIGYLYKKLALGLLDMGYELSVRDGAWCSKKLTKEML